MLIAYIQVVTQLQNRQKTIRQLANEKYEEKNEQPIESCQVIFYRQ